MANVKQVSIQGQVPFNCTENYEMRQMLGQLNAPLMGLRITWLGTNLEMKTAMVAFSIQGTEAVSYKWIENLLLRIVNAGGQIHRAEAGDVDEGVIVKIDIPKPEETQEFVCPVVFNVQDNEDQFEPHQLRTWLEEAVFVDLRTEDGNFDVGEDTTVSMGLDLLRLERR
jgi:hypothetical protein